MHYNSLDILNLLSNGPLLAIAGICDIEMGRDLNMHDPII